MTKLNFFTNFIFVKLCFECLASTRLNVGLNQWPCSNKEKGSVTHAFSIYYTLSQLGNFCNLTPRKSVESFLASELTIFVFYTGQNSCLTTLAHSFQCTGRQSTVPQIFLCKSTGDWFIWCRKHGEDFAVIHHWARHRKLSLGWFQLSTKVSECVWKHWSNYLGAEKLLALLVHSFVANLFRSKTKWL